MPFPTYAEALFSQVLISKRPLQSVWEKPSKKQARDSVVLASQGPQVAEVGGHLDEKRNLLKSLGRFIEDSPILNDEGESSVSFKGGQVVAKKATASDLTLSTSDLLEREPAFWVEPLSPETKILFLGESPKDFSHENPDGDLLSKMIQAMKLEKGQYSRVFFDKDKNKALLQWNDVLLSLGNFQRLVIVSLGAMATNTILQKKERLSRIHGKDFHLDVVRGKGNLSLEVYPVFHPDILQINPNMKRSAWMDLQKVMEVL